MKTGPRLKGQAWTAEDDERLKSMIEASVSIDLIAAKMKRTTQGVKSRAHALGISTKRVMLGPCLRLQPDLDQAADGLGAGFYIVFITPSVDRG
jgi:hypothetical protein